MSPAALMLQHLQRALDLSMNLRCLTALYALAQSDHPLDRSTLVQHLRMSQASTQALDATLHVALDIGYIHRQTTAARSSRAKDTYLVTEEGYRWLRLPNKAGNSSAGQPRPSGTVPGLTFVPASLPPRTKCRHPVAYSIHDNGGHPSALFRISAQLATRAQIVPRTGVRLFIAQGTDTPTFRLSPCSTSTQHWSQRKGNESLYLTLPYVGDLTRLLPITSRITPLHLIDCSPDLGLTLTSALPPQPET